MGDFRRVLWIICLCIVNTCFGNLPGTISDANNIFDALTRTLKCGQFQSLIQGAGLTVQNMYTSQLRLTVFAPNDTAFEQLPKEKLNQIINMSPAEKEKFVKFYTVEGEIQTSGMNDELIKKSLSYDSNRLFFNKRTRRVTNIGGNAGRTEYFVNGALIVRSNVRAGNGMVHVLDRVLDISFPRNALAYIKQPDTKNPTKETAFYREIVNYLRNDDLGLSTFPMQNLDRLTLFVPTDEAIRKIPVEKLQELRSDTAKLLQVVQTHIIKNKVIYTSFVYHNEGFNSMYRQNIFKKIGPEKMYISGNGVTAEIVVGNITVENGAVHYIDSVLGFVYNTARDQIQLDNITRHFEDLTNRGRKELQDYLVRPAGVTVFVPTDAAFDALSNIPNSDLYNNATLIDEVLKRSFLEPGNKFELTKVNGDYDSRVEPQSQYRGKGIKVYSQGNDTWVEGGYVKARVIRPDIGVTNGYVHYIDGVFGVPSRDIPGVIFCEDWLIKTSYVLSTVNLNKYMKDTRIKSQLVPCPSSPIRKRLTFVNTNNRFAKTQTIDNTNTNNFQKVEVLESGGCGESNLYCEFTMFIPNGTAIENFQMTELGLRIMSDRNRLRYVFKRHIIRGRKIYFDTLGRGAHTVTAETGDELRINKQNNRYAEVLFQGQRTRILHADIGATNGVIHIVDRVLHVPEDLTRSAATSFRSLSLFSSVLTLLITYFVGSHL